MVTRRFVIPIHRKENIKENEFEVIIGIANIYVVLCAIL